MRSDPAPVTTTAPALPGRVLLDQEWRDVTFLHWPVPAERVAPLLPPGTRPDLHGGSSWVGLIPFRLIRARFGSGPPLPYLGSFAELNVRLYSVDEAGRRGVVFRSLDASRLGFVLGARAALSLPYAWAALRMDRTDDLITWSSRRRWPGPRGASSRISVRVGREPVVDDPLADFLTARWGLHTLHLRRTIFLPNQHEPWPLQRAELVDLDDGLVAAAGLPGVTAAPPASVLFSPGVRTQFGVPAAGRGQAPVPAQVVGTRDQGRGAG